MFEKVNPAHPDKVADRIAGAIVDLAYRMVENPKIAVEVLIGHEYCNIIVESSLVFLKSDIELIVHRIAGKDIIVKLKQYQQDEHLAENQQHGLRCGDNGIFKGVPISYEEMQLSLIAHSMYNRFKTDGKYIIDKDKIVVCQSNAKTEEIASVYSATKINPLGYWTGGTNVDTGATNRKLGSDMGRAATGGGLHGKDLSKADVSVNIYAHLKAQETQQVVELSCAIGDEAVDGVPYAEIVRIARDYIKRIGGFEKFAEWGLI